MSIKIERLNHVIQEEISMIIMREVKDENIKFVTITGVDTTSDLSYSKVYYTVLDVSKMDETKEALEKAEKLVADGGYGHTASLYINTAEKEKMEKFFL